MSIQSFKCKEVFHCLWIIGTRSHDFCLQCVRSRLVLPSVSSVSLKFSKLRIEWLLWIYFYMIDNMTVWAYDIRCMFKRSKSMPRVHMSSRTNCFFLMKNKLHRNILLRIHWFSKTFREWNYRQFYLDQVNQFFSGIRFIWTIYYSHHM